MIHAGLKVLVLSAGVALLAVPALALPATEEGAERIRVAFATYLGTAAQGLTVVPKGETYAMTLDAGPLFLLGKAQGVTGTATPLEVALTDQGNGLWGVALDQKMAVEAHVPQALDLVETVKRLALTGVFDEKLMSLSQFEGSFEGVTVEETVLQKGQPDTHATITLDSGSFGGTSVANAAAGVDSQFDVAVKGLSEQMETALEPGMPPVPVTIRAESLDETGSITGLRVAQVMPLLAWAVGHADPAAAYGDRKTAKALVQAALPLFDALEGTATAKMLSADTPLGTAGLAEVGGRFAMNGLGTDGKVLEGVTAKGVTLPDGLLPAWAQALVPQDIALEGQVTGFDAAAAIGVALGALDLPDGTDPEPGFEDKILAALLPKGTVSISLNPGGAKNDAYALTWEGSLEAGPQTEIPPFTAKVTLTGMDAVIKALNEAPADMKMTATMGLGAARGIAKSGPGGLLTWEFDGTQPGQVLVNGMDISKIGGAN